MVSLLGGCSSSPAVIENDSSSRPNIVWLISEDNSHHYLDLYFKGGAKTPAIVELAQNGVLYTNAYSNGAVCSVARTTLQTGMYATKIGSQYHRGFHKVPMPKGTKLVQEYLKDAGYFVSNNAKSDYNLNLSAKNTWHKMSKKASWRNRKNKNQPFFHMHTFTASHESRLHFDQGYFQQHKNKYDLNKITLPDYLPDTELSRFTHAFYQSRIEQVDSQIANVIRQLKEDGLLNNTFIFYFSDHGGVLPRGKGYLYDSGLHVPLVVHVPKNYRDQVSYPINSQVSTAVEFVDFAPTVMKLAGLEVPKHFDGQSFLQTASQQKPKQHSLGYADRFDEKYDLIRSIKVGDYHYIRSYQPWLPDGLHNQYRYKMLAYQEWRRLFNEKQLDSIQSQFFKAKPVEMLFNTSLDPHETQNLADSPLHREILKELRTELAQQLKSQPDLGFLPESYFAQANAQDTLLFGQQNQTLISELIDIANLQVQPYQAAKDKIKRAMIAKHPLKNYWGLLVALAFNKKDPSLINVAVDLLHSGSKLVKLRAAEFLILQGRVAQKHALIDLANNSKDPIFVTQVLNVITYLRDHYSISFDTEKLEPKAQNRAIENRLKHLKNK